MSTRSRPFLARYADTKTTFENYRKEVERLFLWSTGQLGKPVSSLTHEDLLAYQRFLADPQPTSALGQSQAASSPAVTRTGVPSPGPLSPSSQRQAFVILNVMFSWLVNAGYLAGNPLSLEPTATRGRLLRASHATWTTNSGRASSKPSIECRGKQSGSERTISESGGCLPCSILVDFACQKCVKTRWATFFVRRDRDGEERWWLEVVGKGTKTRLIPATRELMAELARYRREAGLPSNPKPGEQTPLVLPIGKSMKPLTRAALHSVLKDVFNRASDELRQRGDEYAARAEQLARASAHWLRHTAGSRMADGDLDLRHVRDNLGHESLKTTSQYLHSHDDHRHKETEQKHRINW